MKKKFDKKRIYAVITEKFCLNGSSINTLKDVLKAGVKIVQLREKNMNRDKLIKLAIKYRKLTIHYGAIFIVNDFPDIAYMVKADGVHLGQDDMSVEEVRAKYPELIIGISTHCMKEAALAMKRGADYINIGPIFRTKTKDISKYKPIGCFKLKKIADKITIPFTVMGGIKTSNIRKVSAAGAEIFAMITEITMAENIGGRIAAINKTIGAAEAQNLYLTNF
jgi:thiamine-phosphate pyrophosphorylase